MDQRRSRYHSRYRASLTILFLALCNSLSVEGNTTTRFQHSKELRSTGQHTPTDEYQKKGASEQNHRHKDELQSAMDFTGSKSARDAKQLPIIMILVDGLMARLHLPIFLASISNVGLIKQVVIFNLDMEALHICLKIHHPKLCTDNFGESNINGTHVPVMYDDENGLGSWHHKGWMKTSLTLKTLLLGYDVMFMDIDMIAFQNPFTAIDPETDIAVTVDCQEEYTPYKGSRHVGGPNLGITFFRSNPHMIALVTKWLDKRHPDTWDQNEFKSIVEAAVDELSSLKVQMLKKEQFPVLCCEYCNNFIKPLVQRSWGWRDHCPRQERDKWIVFHATCMNHFREVEGVDYDEGIQKQDILLMIKDLKEQDSLTPAEL